MLAVMAMVFSLMSVNVSAVEDLQPQISPNNVVLSKFGILPEKITNSYVNEDGNSCFVVLYDNGISETVTILPTSNDEYSIQVDGNGISNVAKINSNGVLYVDGGPVLIQRVVESSLPENSARARYSYYDSASPFGISPSNYTFVDYAYDNNVLLSGAMNAISLSIINAIVADICPFAGAAMTIATILYDLAQAYNITTYGLSYRTNRFGCNNPLVLTTIYKYREVWYTGANQTGQSATEVYYWISEFL